MTYTLCWRFVVHLSRFFSFLLQIFRLIRLLGGSFAKFDFSVGSCGFENVPPIG
jgi:hypothetical protein